MDSEFGNLRNEQPAKTSLSRALLLLYRPRPQFLLPGAIAVMIGSSLGFAVAGELNFALAFLALVSIVLLNGGANMVNDYFDHLSGNDWVNENPTPFSGGSRHIQKGIVSPKQMIIAGMGALAAGSLVGFIIVFMTGSIFVLSLGIAGVFGAFFWTAGPVKLCYRFVGEPFIFILFGPLPVWGAYYLQTGRVDMNPLIPGIIIGIIIAMVLEVNTFPDRRADAAVNKRTFVVRFGPKAGVIFYRASISATYVFAVAGLFLEGPVFWGSAAYLITLPIGLAAMKKADVKRLTEPSHVAANKLTIMYHSVAGVLMSAAFIAFSFVNR